MDMSFYRNIIYAITELDKNSNEKTNKSEQLRYMSLLFNNYIKSYEEQTKTKFESS